jgi:hypothetical protein
MKHLPKIFLTVAVVSFAVGLSELGENSFFYMGRPVGAICFVLFMIFQFLSKETAAYDRDHQPRMAALPGAAKPSEPVTAPALSGTRLTQSAA